jgi:hypothetical protein
MLNLSIDSAYIWFGPQRANIFDIVAILTLLLALAYITYQQKPNASGIIDLDSAGKIICELMGRFVSELFKILEWIIILSIFGAAIIKTKSIPIILVWVISFSSLIIYYLFKFSFLARILIDKTEINQKGRLQRGAFAILLFVVFLIISIILADIIQVITDVIIQLSS